MDDVVKHCSSVDCLNVASYEDRCLSHLRPKGRNWKVSIPVDEATFEEVFWMNVRRSDPSSCWSWIGAKAPNGYGHLQVDGKTVGAHRVALEITIGRPIRDGLYACHSCDNPICCNPNHLREGSHLENDHDRRDRFRGAMGESHGSARLTALQVQQARRAVAEGAWQYDVATHFGVTVGAINCLILRKTWRHLPDDATVDITGLPAPRRLRTGTNNPLAKLDTARIADIRERYKSGLTSQQALADEYGVHQSTISSIVRNETWT